MDEMRPEDDPVKKPQSRDKCLSVAYLRLLGTTQKEAAKSVGVSEDTIQRWESCSWWPEILADASRRWLHGLEAKARKTLLDGLDPTLSLKVLERRDPALAPPTQKTDHTSAGQPLTHLTIEYVGQSDDDAED